MSDQIKGITVYTGKDVDDMLEGSDIFISIGQSNVDGTSFLSTPAIKHWQVVKRNLRNYSYKEFNNMHPYQGKKRASKRKLIASANIEIRKGFSHGK